MGGEGSGRKKKSDAASNTAKNRPSGGLRQATLAFGQKARAAPSPAAEPQTNLHQPVSERVSEPLPPPPSPLPLDENTGVSSGPAEIPRPVTAADKVPRISDIHKSLSAQFRNTGHSSQVEPDCLHDLEDLPDDHSNAETNNDEVEENTLDDEEGLEYFSARDSMSDGGNEAGSRDTPAKSERDWPKIEQGTPLAVYVDAVVEKLKTQLKAGSVECYDRKSFWIYPGESVFDRIKGNDPFAYYKDCLLDLFVWIPHLLVPVYCPWCNNEVTNSGFAHNPTGRIISGFRNYVLISYAYECKSCIKWGGKKKHFYGSSKACLDTLDAELAGCFCPILTKKGGIDRDFADFFIPCFMAGMGPHKFAAAAAETAAKRKDRKELNWIMAVNRRISGDRSVSDMLLGKTKRSLLTEVPDYPSYNVDFIPSANYFKGIFCLLTENVRTLINTYLSLLPCEIGKIDLSFKASKRLLRLHGTSVFPALLSFMNNHEEFVGFVLCPSIKTDKRICEDIFPSLREGVVDQNERDVLGLPPFEIESGVQIVFYNDFSRIQSFVADILIAFNCRPKDSPFYVHLDAEWNVDPQHGPQKVAVIQVGYERKIGILVVHSLRTLPSNLISMLKSPDIIKVGKQVGGDVSKILRDYVGPKPTVVGTLELGRYLKERGLILKAGIGLQAIVAQVLKKYLSKDDTLRLSNWEQLTNNSPECEYAAKDINASQQVFEVASKFPLVGAPLKNPQSGDKLSIFSMDKRRKVADGVFVAVRNHKAIVSITKVYVPSAKATGNQTFGSLSIPAEIDVEFSQLVTRSPVEKDPIVLGPTRQIAAEQQKPVFIDEETSIDSVVDEGFGDLAENEDVSLTGLVNQPPQPTYNIDANSAAFGQQEFESIMSVEGETLYTLVIGDPFHLLKSIEVSKFHCLSYDFAVALANAVIVRLKEPKQALLKRFTELGLDYDQTLKSNRRDVLKCIPGVIQEASIVAKSWKEVCEIYGPQIDPKRGPLFSKENWKQASNGYKALLSGQYSDPPGVQLYRKCGMHPIWKVPLLHCSRGTVSNEGTAHKQALDTFRSYNLGPMSFVGAMHQLAIRSSLKNGTKHRTGRSFTVGHYDLSLINRLHGAYIMLGLKLPTRLLDWVNTDFYSVPEGRRIGILEIPKDDREKYKMDSASFRFSTNLSSRTFIAREQGLKYPALPILTKEERDLFKSMIMSSTRTDFEEMSVNWNTNDLVDGKLITYKLPEHLSAYHAQLKDREREQEAIFIAGELRRELVNRVSQTTVSEILVPPVAFPRTMTEQIAQPEFPALEYQYENDSENAVDDIFEVPMESIAEADSNQDIVEHELADSNQEIAEHESLDKEGAERLTAGSTTVEHINQPAVNEPPVKRVRRAPICSRCSIGGCRGAGATKFCFLTKLADGTILDRKDETLLDQWETGFMAKHLRIANNVWENQWLKGGEVRAKRRSRSAMAAIVLFTDNRMGE
ncbi:hypothetical protein BCR33DRAFT_846120 [Rhizoclosmatium globosum]|uniref:3'-5' exonuclease domain-containing protein n=1 Tax=Rhizoclosmatium globosum TaxID=329046 RepID=A0A1Y2CY68_9FUNG|nr:hypothetical protein BCR33DRAFT_846120 [Rhizoclosmatium globosum]|eukprot:ORY51285.1 hypothetical protein BCR33DRAFT_846120 [Rhizoclosmatium globosum]